MRSNSSKTVLAADASLVTRLGRLLLGDGDWPAVDDGRGWGRLVSCAQVEGVAGLVWEAVRERGIALPDEVQRELVATADQTAGLNRHRLTRLERIVTAFAEADVGLVVLKGAALLGVLYDDLSLRPMTDVDLLIRPADADRADGLLRRLGYEPGRNLLRADFFPRFHYERDYVGGGSNGVRLDVHVRPWRPLRYARTVPDGALMGDVVGVPMGGTVMCVPSATNMLIHLLCHASFHGGGRLIWAMDVRRFVDWFGDQIDWSMFVERLRVWRLIYAARVGIEWVESQVGCVIPDDVRRRLADERVSWRDRLAVRQSPEDAAHPVRRTVVDMLCTPGLGFRFGYLRAVILPDAAHLAASYGGRHVGWTWCALVGRWLRGVFGAVGKLWRRDVAGVDI